MSSSARRALVFLFALLVCWVIAGTDRALADCPLGEMPNSAGACVCFDGKAPPANETCPLPAPCLLTGTCPCPAGQQSGLGYCCPQGQFPLSNGNCGDFTQMVASTLINHGMCPPTEVLLPNGTCMNYGFAGACIRAPKVPPGGSDTSSENVAVCCLPGQVPATAGVPASAGYGGTLHYTGACCPVGQTPQSDGTCVPKQNFITGCPGNAPFNAQTNSCCPQGYSISNRYQCCPPGKPPAPDGSCGCPYGWVQQGDGSCKSLCGPKSVPGSGNDFNHCSSCPDNQVSTLQNTCCAPGQFTDTGYCCPSAYHPVGAYCMPGSAFVSPSGNQFHVLPGLTGARPLCGGGLMPRDAFRGDQVCVTEVLHTQILIDNAAAPTRTRPDGGCLPGYVWREAGADDHVCVLPATRSQVWGDNRSQCGGDRRCRSGVVVTPNVPVARIGIGRRTTTIFRPHRATVTRHTVTQHTVTHGGGKRRR